MRDLRIILFAVLFSIMGSIAFSATPKWTLLPVESDKEIYLDKANFYSNLDTRKDGEIYEVTYWIRQSTLQKNTYFEHMVILQTDKQSGVVRYKTLVSRYVRDGGESVAGTNHTGWERLVPGDPIDPVFLEIWKYDQNKKNEEKDIKPQKESPKMKEDKAK